MIPHGPNFIYFVLWGEAGEEVYYYEPRADWAVNKAYRIPFQSQPEILPEELMDDDQAIDFLPTGQSWMSPILAMFGNNHAVPAKAIAIVLTQRNCGNCANSAKTAPVPRCGLCCGANSRQSEWRNLNAC